MRNELLKVLTDDVAMVNKLKEVNKNAVFLYSSIMQHPISKDYIDNIKLSVYHNMYYLDIDMCAIKPLQDAKLISKNFYGMGMAMILNVGYVIVVSTEVIKQSISNYGNELEFDNILPFVLYHEFGHCICNHIADYDKPDEIEQHEKMADAIATIQTNLDPEDLFKFSIFFREDQGYSDEIQEKWVNYVNEILDLASVFEVEEVI